MEKTETAVEWLVLQLLIYGDKAFNKEISLGEYHIKKEELINQAKEMEKEQIKKAYEYGNTDREFGIYLESKQYYENNYEKTN